MIEGCDTSTVVGKACASGAECFAKCPGVRGVCTYNKRIVVPSLMLAPAYAPPSNGTNLPRAGSVLPKWCQDSLGGGIRYGEECSVGLCTGNPAYDGKYTDVSTGIQGEISTFCLIPLARSFSPLNRRILVIE